MCASLRRIDLWAIFIPTVSSRPYFTSKVSLWLAAILGIITALDFFTSAFRLFFREIGVLAFPIALVFFVIDLLPFFLRSLLAILPR